MQFNKQTVIELLRSRGDNAKADQAQQELPDLVDAQQYAGLLSKLGLDPHDHASKLPGDLGSKLGGLLGPQS